MRNYHPQVLVARQDRMYHPVCVPTWVSISHMVCVEMETMQELPEEFVLGSANGSCVKLFFYQ